MSTKKSQEGKTLTQEEIDRQVEADASSEDAWDAPIRVNPTVPTSSSCPTRSTL